MAVLICPGSCAGAIAFKRTVGLALDDPCITSSARRARCRMRCGSASRASSTSSTCSPAVFTSRDCPAPRDRPAARPGQRGRAGRRAGRERLPDHAAERQPRDRIRRSPCSTPRLLERTGGRFLFYEEGVTVGVGFGPDRGRRQRTAGDRHSYWGVTILSEPALGVRQGYMREENYSTGYSSAPGFLGDRSAEPGQTIATSPRTSATRSCSCPTWPRASASPRQ